MMLSERHRSHPTVQIPSSDDPTPYLHSLSSGRNTEFGSLHGLTDPDFDSDSDPDPASELYSSDYFRMYEFKVRKCMRARSHDWTECPFAHPGEKARRRDPRKYNYSGHACPDFRKGSCSKGDCCEYAHGVFECWLHPSRYRTQPCKDGLACQRRVCFFAHCPEQLRIVSPTGSGFNGFKSKPVLVDGFGSMSSPPASPVDEVVRSMRSLQLSRMNSLPNQFNPLGSVFGSPGSLVVGFRSLPSTPTRAGGEKRRGYGVGCFESVFEVGEENEEEPAMERVESGRDLRMQMFERISKESCLDRIVDKTEPENAGPDLGWVSELLK